MSDASRKQGFLEQTTLHGLRRIHELPCTAEYAIAQRQRADGAGRSCDTEKPVSEHFFAFDANGEPTVQLICTPPWSNKNGGCRSYFLYKGMAVTAIFRRAELHRWREFIDGTENLLDRVLS
ncbi:MAG TPA: hypothetical protein VES91_04530 [Burkholderiaceae bacterium]|nr:hypothetical protein [Burkholderiaceae bacterium]